MKNMLINVVAHLMVYVFVTLCVALVFVPVIVIDILF